MAKIMNVDYEQMPSQARQMREYGKELNSQLTTAYQSITDMHSVWYGKRYNALIEQFNNLIPQLDQMLELVVGEIPFTLETIANNYSQADKGSNVTGANRETPNKINTVPTSKEVGMKFLTAEVEGVQNKVSTNFQKSKELMNTIESEYAKVQWESEASAAFKAKFKKLKDSIVQSFENINSQFTKLMNQTKDDIQAAETANTVS